MTEPTPNLPLLRKVLDHIDAHPTEWLQEIWGTDHAIVTSTGEVDFDLTLDVSECHTAFCIAGWAVFLDGTHKISFQAGGMVVDNFHFSAGGVAQQLLGLTDEESGALFHYGNKRADVQAIAKRIAERAGEVL